MPEPLRILHLRSLFHHVGGAETIVFSLARGMNHPGCIPFVALVVDSRSARTDHWQPLAAGWDPDRIMFTPWARNIMVLNSVRRLRRVIRTWRIQVLHSHDNRCNFLALLARTKGVGIVSSVHGWAESVFPKMRLLSGLDTRVQSRFDNVIAAAETVRARLLASGLDPEKVVTIPTGVDTSFEQEAGASPRTRAALGIPGSARVVVMLARFTAEKGHDLLVRAAGQVRRQCPDTWFLLVGEGPLRAATEAAVSEAGLTDCFRFTGFRESVTEYLAAADLAVLPSRTECVPLSILEAMRARLPVVASAVGGIPEFVADGESGTLIPPDDHEALASALIDILSDMQRARAMGERGRWILETRFSMQDWLQRHEDVYRQVVQRLQPVQLGREHAT